MSGPSLHLSLPPRSLFKFPPDEAPPAIPPPSDHINFIASPFPIPDSIFQATLHPAVPLTIAALYATTVSTVNAYNRKHGNKAWAISKTRPFFAFVIFHNVFLAVYSAVTSYAMIQSLYNTWAGWTGQHGIVGAVDSLCKMHGPRGLGDAATYNPVLEEWEVKNQLIHLSSGLPDSTDVGRLWNEGLAFWGWWFYLSKFYEVLDTAIILAKGKRSTTLQTYHHAGAMMCMWAGIRYMAPPIWMFVQVNSAIHAMMYTYYTLSALGVRVPQAVKRSLTTMQITQFVVGGSFAILHLCIQYTVPVSTPYRIAKAAQVAVSTASSALSSVASEATAASAVAGFGSYIKKLALRAAGEEGLAENMGERPHVLKDQIAAKFENLTGHTAPGYETRFRNEYQWVQCIDTTGQSFAVWLNLMYLAPLTALFVRFFVKSYMRRIAPISRGDKDAAKKGAKEIANSAHDAAKGVNRETDKVGKRLEINGIANGVANGATNGTANGIANGAKTNGTINARKSEMNAISNEKRSIDDHLSQIPNDDTQTVLRRQSVGETSPTDPSGSDLDRVENVFKKEKSTAKEDGECALPSPPASDIETDEAKDEQVGKEEGLGTTDPRDENVNFSDILKRPNA
ncbi:hypothetical protein EJ05DRAFT_487015 [Pseudovirgaria hyperparasitica]|uniref:Elongation of fatty acids protein n=1 Tax=Pseudovirgaria hyperparasitica TaxID=470096 RepID=A0A6A6W4C6_9PEZI|nr:uncharacterized protein EJ05DRAFT_487015 [Pseudovirgaria hyperparasitica]KAF2757019.1 hypothetical protein EJ05DRAFT_487015 [Pseudovirgaria hyperparasitica]